MQSKKLQLETEQILNIPKEWEFTTKRVIMTWDEEKKELEIRPDYRRRMFRLPGQPKVIPNDWKIHVYPLTAKERREIKRYKKAN